MLLGKNISGETKLLDLARPASDDCRYNWQRQIRLHEYVDSMLFKFKPEELKLIMADPKVVEVSALQRLAAPDRSGYHRG